MLRNVSYVACVLPAAVVASPLAAQPAPPDTVRRIAELHATVLATGATIGPRIWPGFRPDTIPTLYVIPRQAKLFAQWRDTLPTGFFPLDGAGDLAWTDTRVVSFPPGRPIAFLSVDSTSSPGSVLGLALHEAFHAFQQASGKQGRRFGAGENSILVATYPIFDVENEAAFALEGALLARALRARSLGDARRLARELLAVRERRQARLDTAFAAFEAAAELHEGLAQYAQLRGLRELAGADPRRFASAAAAEARLEVALLDSLLAIGPRSVRRRFYATGSAIALLLDRLADSTWKERLVRDDATLQRALAGASGYRGVVALDRAWERRTGATLARLRVDAEHAAVALDARRRAQRDSILDRPGLRLVIDPSRLRGGRFDWCGFDPQNVLQTAGGELLHMRMLRLCGAGLRIEFAQPVVEDRSTGIVRAAAGEESAVELTASGVTIRSRPAAGAIEVSDLRLAGPGFTLFAPRAIVARRGDELRVTPIPNP